MAQKGLNISVARRCMYYIMNVATHKCYNLFVAHEYTYFAFTLIHEESCLIITKRNILNLAYKSITLTHFCSVYSTALN